MMTCRQPCARRTGGRLFGFVRCHRMFRWWTYHRMIIFVIHSWQCGERGHRRVFRVVICSRQFALWTCLRRPKISEIPPGVGAVDLTPEIRAVDVPAVGRMETVQPTTSPDSVQMSPDSPPTVVLRICQFCQCRCPPIVRGLRTLRMFRKKDPCLRYRRILWVY